MTKQTNYYFEYRIKHIEEALKSNRIDKQISSLNDLEIEFLEYEDEQNELSFMSMFKTYEKKAPPAKYRHIPATKKELQKFIKSNNQFLLEMISSNCHAELIKHSVNLLKRIHQFGSIPNTFFKELYLKSEQIGGKTCLNTQEMILELWDKLNSNERNWFVSHVMDNSIQSPNGNSKETNEMKESKQSKMKQSSKHKEQKVEEGKDSKENKEQKEIKRERNDNLSIIFMCKMIEKNILSSTDTTKALNYIVPKCHQLIDLIIPLMKKDSIGGRIKSMVLQLYTKQEESKNKEMISSLLRIVNEASLNQNDIDNLKMVIQCIMKNQMKEMNVYLKTLGKKEKELFSYCLKAIIEVNGLQELDNWIDDDLIKIHLQVLMKTIIKIKDIPSSSCKLFRKIFLQYNHHISQGLLLKDNNPDKIFFEKIEGREMLLKMFLTGNLQSVDLIVQTIYSNRLKYFVVEVLKEFKGDLITQNGLEKIRNMIIKLKNITTDKSSYDSVSLKRIIKENNGIKQPELKVSLSGYIYENSDDMRMYKKYAEEINNDLKELFESLSNHYEFFTWSVNPTTTLREIVLTTINQIKNVEDEYMLDSISNIIKMIKNQKFDLDVRINGKSVNMNEMISYYIPKSGEIEMTFKQSEKINEILKQQSLSSSTSSSQSSKKEQTKTPRGSNITPRSNSTQTSTQSTSSQQQIKIKEDDLIDLISLLNNKEYSQYGIDILKEINEFIVWKRNPIEMITVNDGNQIIGIARLFTQQKLSTDECRIVLDVLLNKLTSEHTAKNESQSSIEKSTTLLSQILLKQTKFLNKKKNILLNKNENQIVQLSKLESMIETKDFDEYSMTMCFIILLINNSNKTPWHKKVHIPSIKTVVEKNMTDELFDIITPYIYEQNQIIEECSDILIKFIDKKYTTEDEFMQQMLTSILQFEKGMKFSIRAFKRMKTKQEMLHPFILTIIQTMFPDEKELNDMMNNEDSKELLDKLFDDSLMTELMELICECLPNVDEETQNEVIEFYTTLLNKFEKCGEVIEVRKGKWGGLINQGCTCYMNSVLQQLFHTEKVRYYLINSTITPPKYVKKIEEKKENETENQVKEVKIENDQEIYQSKQASESKSKKSKEKKSSPVKEQKEIKTLQHQDGNYYGNLVSKEEGGEFQQAILESLKTMDLSQLIQLGQLPNCSECNSSNEKKENENVKKESKQIDNKEEEQLQENNEEQKEENNNQQIPSNPTTLEQPIKISKEEQKEQKQNNQNETIKSKENNELIKVIQDEENPNEKETKEKEFITHNINERKDYRMIEALQKLFIEMQESIINVTDTRRFCRRCHGVGYEKINVYEQMDAPEFLTVLLTAMENCKECPKIVEATKIFTGEMEVKIISECGHVVKRHETFVTSPLEVEHHKSVNESLDELIKETTIMDYRCEQCGHKGNCRRIEKYRKLPEKLIFHLKRFGYNDQFEIVKFNSYFEYPEEIDMRKYCIKRDIKNTKYKLVGITIHSGNAQGGHYFSDILVDDQWLCFNDSRVDEGRKKDWYGNNHASAYMLYYEKIIEEEEIELEDSDDETNGNNQNDNKTNKNDKELNEQLQQINQQITTDRNSRLKRNIELHNSKYYFSKQITSQTLVAFIQGITTKCQYIGNTLSFLRNILIKRNRDDATAIFVSIGSIVTKQLAKEILSKISGYYLGEYIQYGSSMIISCIHKCEDNTFVSKLMDEVKNATPGSIEIMKELHELQQISDFEACRLSREFLMNQTYERSEGKICLEYLLKGIREKKQINNLEDLIEKLQTSTAPEYYIKQFLSTFETVKLSSYAVKLVNQMTKTGTAEYLDLLQLKRLVKTREIARKITEKLVVSLNYSNTFNKIIALLSIIVKSALVSPYLYDELKNAQSQINKLIDWYAIKVKF